MKAQINRLLILLVATLSIAPALAQVEATQYFMSNLPQVSASNPAFVPEYNFSIGLPLISATSYGYYNSSFSYNNLITKSNGEVTADLPKWVKSLSDRNYITTTAQTDLLRVGFRINPNVYMQVSSTAYAYSRTMIPKEMAALFVDGTAPLVGTTTHFSPQEEGLSYLETSVSAAFKIDPKMTLGGRIKYLNGVMNVTTTSSDMSLSVGTDYQLRASGNLNLKTSGVNNFQIEQNAKDAMANTGFAFDLGATYKVTDKLTLAASLVDIGKINWKANNYSYTLDSSTANFTFSGFDMKELVGGNTGYLHAQSDSISKHFTPVEGTIGPYSTSLPAKIYLSGTYQLTKGFRVGALFSAVQFRGQTSAGATISGNQKIGRWMTAMASYTVSNNSYNNLGLGLSFHVKPVQFYIAGDNILGLPASLAGSQNINAYLNSAQVLNLRFGINFVWGRDKSLDPKGTVDGKSVGKKNERVTSGKASYLKVRKRTSVNRKVRK